MVCVFLKLYFHLGETENPKKSRYLVIQFNMERYRVKYHYGSTNGETVLELRGGSEGEALNELRRRYPSDVYVVNAVWGK